VRERELGRVNRRPAAPELERMKALVAQAMQERAIGLTTALSYTPATFALTAELIELARAASDYGGIYTAHMRSEGGRLLEAIDETIRIAREAEIPVESYHLKAAGQSNWPRMDQAIAKIDSARAEGVRITADMYTYTAGATGFDAAMPPWVQEGRAQRLDRLFPHVRGQRREADRSALAQLRI
jgi:N-acyl-D-amino-acid deacylase